MAPFTAKTFLMSDISPSMQSDKYVHKRHAMLKHIATQGEFKKWSSSICQSQIDRAYHRGIGIGRAFRSCNRDTAPASTLSAIQSILSELYN